MNKYLMMLVAAGLIAAAPVYYAVNAHADDVVVEETVTTEVDGDVDCTQAVLEGEELPAGCEVEQSTETEATVDTHAEGEADHADHGAH